MPKSLDINMLASEEQDASSTSSDSNVSLSTITLREEDIGFVAGPHAMDQVGDRA